MNRLKKLSNYLVAATVLTTGLLASDVALGNQLEPQFFHRGTYLEAVSWLRHLAYQPVDVTIEAQGHVRVECINPGGQRPPGAQPPGPVDVPLVGSRSYQASDLWWWWWWGYRLDVRVVTASLGSQIAGAPHCPNPNWTENVVGVLRIDQARFVARQGGQRVSDFNCTFSPPLEPGQWPFGWNCVNML
jgi:hypothetical protein